MCQVTPVILHGVVCVQSLRSSYTGLYSQTCLRGRDTPDQVSGRAVPRIQSNQFLPLEPFFLTPDTVELTPTLGGPPSPRRARPRPSPHTRRVHSPQVSPSDSVCIMRSLPPLGSLCAGQTPQPPTAVVILVSRVVGVAQPLTKALDLRPRYLHPGTSI